MFSRVLIANRGEIAVRVIRACKELGVESVAVYSVADKESQHVKLADHAVCIGPADAKSSYLNMDAIISAALVTNSQAIHPGFGFLSENHQFARMCEDNDIKFIGPRSSIILTLGDKTMAKEFFKDKDIPYIDGPDGAFDNLEKARDAAIGMGFPLILKAVSGGGGRGIRVVQKLEDFDAHYRSASKESEISFNDKRMYMEKFLGNPKHVEFQMLCDTKGNSKCIGMRDCSIQRRNQKLIEEVPGDAVDMEEAAKLALNLESAFLALDYHGAATAEFLYQGGKFFFMEVNPRIQVEHTVTEESSDIDIVRQQLLIAFGNPIERASEYAFPNRKYHAIECRINAEDPENDFRPCAGQITGLHFPGGIGVRIDSAITGTSLISPFYDSMIAKIIVKAPTRDRAIVRMIRTLDELRIEGVKTNREFLLHVLQSPDFLNGDFSIHTVEKILR
jgi:acetyl-CoA carboxylase biotin carboxylase subunit